MYSNNVKDWTIKRSEASLRVKEERSTTIMRGFNMQLKAISDFDGYFISKDGKVFCNLGKGNRRKTDRTVDLYEIKPRPLPNGYLRVYMRNTKTNKRMDKYIHRLVAEAFVRNPDNKPFVNHRDCNRTNNVWYNLEWVTYKENTKQTEDLEHVIRDDKGRFVSNIKSWDSLLPSEKAKINEYIFIKACQNTVKAGV